MFCSYWIAVHQNHVTRSYYLQCDWLCWNCPLLVYQKKREFSLHNIKSWNKANNVIHIVCRFALSDIYTAKCGTKWNCQNNCKQVFWILLLSLVRQTDSPTPNSHHWISCSKLEAGYLKQTSMYFNINCNLRNCTHFLYFKNTQFMQWLLFIFIYSV